MYEWTVHGKKAKKQGKAMCGEEQRLVFVFFLLRFLCSFIRHTHT